ncbi:uncharacterized protein F5891DRAFT_1248049 [Suillus fuscotomentosus]|uniref:Uncharacterized protein n=1 Tax=Suillus fuscotomentosus TaxID=1912939 RepID=A0AAD4DY03_9AGAM|nr:uncharacterized protein F5891DRAFT_1248049 [Suillus fuscotomentosus]KAG1896155.1 hypothetical protein F5891DRAFT_1248049 [Suillus fuscotomentosus]
MRCGEGPVFLGASDFLSGLQIGGESEFIKVKEFIAARSKKTKLTNRLHAIWSFTAAEKKFFYECNTGSVPVIIVFTKFNALYNVAYSQLKKEGKSRKDTQELALKHADETFPDGPQLKFLKSIKWPPKGHVCLPNMNEDNVDCGALIECMAGTLNDEMLEQLFVSTQQTNLEICMRYAIERTLPKHPDSAKSMTEGYKEIVGTLGAWFPHIWWHYLQDRQNSDSSFYVTLEQYMPSPHAAAVREGMLFCGSNSADPSSSAQPQQQTVQHNTDGVPMSS